MRICLFGDARSVHIQRLASGLTGRGLDVHVVSHKPADVPGVSVERFHVPPPGLANPYRWQGRWERYLCRFLRRFDIVNIHFLADWGFTPRIMREGCVVATAWGSDVVPPPGEGAPSPELVEKRIAVLRHADAVTTCGPTFASTVAKFAGMSADRIDVVPFGVDLELFAPRGARDVDRLENGATHFGPRAFPVSVFRAACLSGRQAGFSPRGFFGYRLPSKAPEPARNNENRSRPVAPAHEPHVQRVGFYKGFREVYGPTDLIRAIPMVLEALPETQFDLVGDGPQLAKCQAMASELRIGDRVTWIPRQPHREIPGWLAQWDLTVIPSVYEAFGVAALESAAMRVPVVASNVGGLPDAVRDGETGLLVPPRSPGALGRAIIALLADSPLRRRMGEAGREWVQGRFGMRRVLDQWISLFRRVVDRVTAPV